MVVIEKPRSIITACDVDDFDVYKNIVNATANNENVGGCKIGFDLALGYGLPIIVGYAKENAPDKIVIYDHQKAGNDIPEMGTRFAKRCRKSGVDAIILFPFTGPKTQKIWTEAAFEEELGVITGGHMTHAQFLLRDGGYIGSRAIRKIYGNAVELGVENFVAPGNQPEILKRIKEYLESLGIDPTFYSPGFIAQGGSITDGAKAAGERFHAIIGRGVYWNKTEERFNTLDEMKAAAEELTGQLYENGE